MFCKSCGAEISDKAVVCVHCGVQTCTRVIPGFAYFDKSGISKSEESFLCRLSPNEVDARMCNLSAYGAIFDLVGRNALPDGFEYSLSANIGLCSWGELIYVRCAQHDAGSYVTVFSKCAFPLQVIAWGKHGRNIAQIRNALTAR